MSEHVRLIENYHRLVRKGDKVKAQKALETYWEFKRLNKKSNDRVVVPESKIVKEKERTLDSLIKIKGIGKETVKDIKSIYSDFNSLMKILISEGNIPLRNDVVKKLKKNLLNI